MSGDVRLPVIEVSASAPREDSTVEEQESLRTGTRTPRPYCHDGEDILQDYEQPVPKELDVPVNGDGGVAGGTYSANKGPSTSGQPSAQASVTGSDSGTEADDERPVLVKALPAPHLRPRKGLKTGEVNADVLLTPSQLDDEGRRLSRDYFKRSPSERAGSVEAEAEQEKKLLKIRIAEFARRSSEVALMIVLGLCVLCGNGVLREAYGWRRELVAHVAIISLLVLAYPVKLSVVDGGAQTRKIWERFRVPASFDPATILYPTLLPVLVALSVAPANPDVLLPNIILALSSLPQRLFPRSSRGGGFNVVHWFTSIIPLILAVSAAWPSQRSLAALPKALSSETLVSLYPLHHALLQALQYLTTTSLLISELHLLSAALINLLLLAQSPQMVMLKACLWIGGVPILAFCASILNWNVTLMRVPKWRFRRTPYTARKRKSTLMDVLGLFRLSSPSNASRRADNEESDADEDEHSLQHHAKNIDRKSPLRISSLNLGPWDNSNGSVPHSAIEPTWKPNGSPLQLPIEMRPRRNTLPSPETPAHPKRPQARRSRDKSPRLAWYLDMTSLQAQNRKVLYAACIYLIIIAVVLIPVRGYVLNHALGEQEPIGWAIGYLFGQISQVRSFIQYFGLQVWISLPAEAKALPNIPLSLPLHIPAIRDDLGTANVRLILIAYWAAVLVAGLLVVFSLTAFVEVDTRRKVFHGVMVAMMLPSTFIDPCACALALTIILALFLLLEVIRAGQVLPLGNAIGRFVAPYVDGRDLRGPVVISHIFLLIGCAVPLWFSLASMPRSGGKPWTDWEVAADGREVAMVAGVICVGMGDAAASLIGRRYGRHKWMWVGGKSLEGSAAFAAAVTIGLMASKAWLVLGGWNDTNGPLLAYLGMLGIMPCLRAWLGTFVKALFCAYGASFMEAVLTGANDNVVVPIALWLLVRGVRL